MKFLFKIMIIFLLCVQWRYMCFFCYLKQCQNLKKKKKKKKMEYSQTPKAIKTFLKKFNICPNHNKNYLIGETRGHCPRVIALVKSLTLKKNTNSNIEVISLCCIHQLFEWFKKKKIPPPSPDFFGRKCHGNN